MKRNQSVRIVLLSLALTGCAGFGIVATSDPLTKLNDAEDLFMRQQRPLPAERLIFEALQIYRERDDPHGLGHAHREYADLLLSFAVLKWRGVYTRDGFRDKSVTMANRREKAAEYYRKAVTYYERAVERHKQAEKFDALFNVYFNKGWAHYMLDEREPACVSYQRALDTLPENVKRHPAEASNVPALTEAVEAMQRRVGCN